MVIRDGRGRATTVDMTPPAATPPAPVIRELPVVVGLELPCPGCLHLVVCRIRERLEATPLTVRAPAPPDPAIALELTARVSCDSYLPAERPRPVDPRIRRGGMAARALEVARRRDQVIATLERHGGDRRAAALELGMRPQALALVLKAAGR